jgi:hypothetical protein
MNLLHRKLRVALACVTLLFTAAAWAQTPQDLPQKPTGQPTAPAEHKISPAEAKELFRSVDEILQFASQDTGFPIKHKVKRRLTSREEVEGFLEKSMAEDKDTQRLRRSELVLKKFGLLPRDFDFQKFLVALLKEQVAGYYDPKTRTVNLLDWIEPLQQRPVLAHELTHALQDQSFGLRKFMKSEDLADKKDAPTPADIQNDEISVARQAVVEGQAMAVLVDYMLAPSGRSLKNSPDILEAMKQDMLSGSQNSPEMRSAPIFLRDALIFPYRYGLDFTAALLTGEGKEKAFAGAFTHPPVNSRHIMEPQTYLADEQIPPLPLPDFQNVFRDYERFDIGAIGEFDVSVLIEQYAGADAAQRLYPQWRGGYYYAVRPKANPAATLGLLYLSRWSNPDHAAEFAAIYANSLAKRYEHVQVSADGGLSADDISSLVSLTGTHTWQTEEGPVVIAVRDDMVLVTESLDQAMSETLEKALLPSEASPAK